MRGPGPGGVGYFFPQVSDRRALPDSQVESYLEHVEATKDAAVAAIEKHRQKHGLDYSWAKEILEYLGLVPEADQSLY